MSNNIAWEQVDWAAVRYRVSRYQYRIYKASLNSKKAKVRFLQKQLLSSLDSKLYAVFSVTTWNKGKKNPGVDKNFYMTNKHKMSLVQDLRLDGKTVPFKSIWIPKEGEKEKSSLCIPIIKDRAKQTLFLLALEPEWEARFESNSYGFRPGKSCHDAIEAILFALGNKSKKVESKYILDVDLSKCFSSLNHEYLIKKIDSLPEVNKQLESWLKYGMIKDCEIKLCESIVFNKLFQEKGRILYAFLVNVALHGMQNHLKDWINNYSILSSYANKGKKEKQKSLSVIRYTDNCVIIHPSKKTLILAKEEISKWLKETSGLEFKNTKNSISLSAEGFNFLGFSFIMVNQNSILRYKAYPSREAQKKILYKVRDIIQTNRNVSAYVLITKLKPVIIGWANYYRYCECKETFAKLTHLIFKKLKSWVFRRDTRNGRQKVKEKYFPSGQTYTFDGVKHEDNWVFYGECRDKRNEIRKAWLPHLVWVKSRKWVKVKGKASVYDGNNAYWAQRSMKYSYWNFSERYLIYRQKGYCSYCKGKIMSNDLCKVDNIMLSSLGGRHIQSNKQLIHIECYLSKTSTNT
uniref:Putative reverse transcriptase/maturase n=1 Tax=Bulboplastis apyrenoidosa TaxID=1070855 RepID=A0A1Y9TMF9_9RHOD|nr:putative reverse transcriptase/maturase [Bulboplastis apyrenoidosa]ARO90857.1 putative reverse transcriptase/maturase [Bulboplastis apyrenoidosa]